LPRKIAPAARRCATAGASATAGLSGVVHEPLRDGTPATSMLSLMVAGRPSSAPAGSPFAQRASETFAAASALSASTRTKALIAGSHMSIRASACATTSTGDSALRR